MGPKKGRGGVVDKAVGFNSITTDINYHTFLYSFHCYDQEVKRPEFSLASLQLVRAHPATMVPIVVRVLGEGVGVGVRRSMS